MSLDVVSKLFVVCEDGNLLSSGVIGQVEGVLFVYTSFINADIECVYHVLESILGIFPLDGGH